MKCFTKRPSAKQDKLIKEECRKEFYNLLNQYNHEALIQMLYVLHFEFGFGEKRLYRFAEKIGEMQKSHKETYLLEDSDTAFICEKKLKDDGLNIDKILQKR